LGSKAAVPLLFALLIGGCPKRQTEPLVVYVQPPAGKAALKQNPTSTTAPETLTIDEPPPPPAPAQPSRPVAASSAPQTQQSTRKSGTTTTTRPDSHANQEVSQPSDTTSAPDTAQAPPLEPASDASSEEDIRAQDSDVRHRIDGLADANYSSPADRQILEDARSFVTQSEEALKVHDLLRAQELAQKAGLLLRALEQRP
jgi:hypothetical protein